MYVSFFELKLCMYLFIFNYLYVCIYVSYIYRYIYILYIYNYKYIHTYNYMVKAHTTISLDYEVLTASKGNSINISKVCNDALAVENSIIIGMKDDKDLPKEKILENTVIHLKNQLIESQKIIKQLNADLETGKNKYEKLRNKNR